MGWRRSCESKGAHTGAKPVQHHGQVHVLERQPELDVARRRDPGGALPFLRHPRVLEAFRRGDARSGGKKPVETPTNASFAAAKSSPARRIKIVFRRVDKLGIGWHWALALGDSIWEVAGVPMAIVGPRGVVVGIPYPGHKGASSGARLSHYDGYIQMQGTSRKTDDEIDKFSRDWASRHPLYNAYGPNCQTFTEDLFIYLTGQNLGFAKFADLQSGPEKSAEAVWLNPSKKPW